MGKSIPATGKSTGKAHRSGLILGSFVLLARRDRGVQADKCVQHSLSPLGSQLLDQQSVLQGQLITNPGISAPRGLIQEGSRSTKNVACVWKH